MHALHDDNATPAGQAVNGGLRRCPSIAIGVARGLLARAASLALLMAIAMVADGLCRLTALPLPASVLGMLVLLALLRSGLTDADRIEAHVGWLLRHLAFFFVPIAVGLVAYFDLLVGVGGRILIVLVVSAAAGLLAAGWVVQLLASEKS